MTLVSVVIPTYNAHATIARALKSVRGQSHSALEIIVVDDCSTDSTPQVVERCSGPDLMFLRLGRNLGAAAARNAGVSLAKGEYVAFLDADDEWHPEKISRQMDLLASSPGCAMVVTDATMLLPDGSHWSLFEACPPREGYEAWKGLLERNFVPTPGVMVRRENLIATGGFDPELPVGEDLDLWIRIAEKTSLLLIREPLVTVHIRHDSLLRSHPRGELDYVLPMIARHLERLRPRLTASEHAHIKGVRAFEFGYRLYRQGLVREALPLFWEAARWGERPVRSLSFFPRAVLKGLGISRPGASGALLIQSASDWSHTLPLS